MTLELKELKEDYSEQNQAIYILAMLDDFEIRNKLSYMIINNIDFNNRLIAIIATTLNKEEVFYNIKQRRLRYNNHVINLAI